MNLATSAAIPPPRVPGAPLLGHLLEMRRDPIGLALRVARDFGEVAEIRVGLFKRLVVNSGAAAHEVLVEKADCFATGLVIPMFAGPLLGESMLTANGDVHRKLRRMVAPAFVHKRVAAHGDVMVERTRRTANRLAALETADLAEEITRLTLEIAGKTLLDAELDGETARVGKAVSEAGRRLAGAVRSLVPMPPTVPTLANLRYRRAARRLDTLIDTIIRERRASGVERGDMLDMLLATRDEDGSALDDRELRGQVKTIFVAGYETVANALAWTFYLVARHPVVRERMEREIDAALGDRPATLEDLPKMPFTLQVFKESMRLYPSISLIERKATADVTIRGVQVRNGEYVLVNIVGIHRRSDVFSNPDRFDPDRFAAELEKKIPPSAYLPFGSGAHFCVGNRFALMEAHLILATLCRHLRFDLLSEDPITTELLISLHPRGGVPVRVTRRGELRPIGHYREEAT